MNPQSSLLLNSSSAQADFISSVNGQANGNHLVHLKRFGHYSACGKDFIYFRGMTATSKVKDVSCRTCIRAHQRLVDLKRAARAWRREHNPLQPAVVIKQPADLGPLGLAAIETAFQLAVERTEAR